VSSYQQRSLGLDLVETPHLIDLIERGQTNKVFPQVALTDVARTLNQAVGDDWRSVDRPLSTSLDGAHYCNELPFDGVVERKCMIPPSLASADHFPLSANFHWSSDGNVMVLEVAAELVLAVHGVSIRGGTCSVVVGLFHTADFQRTCMVAWLTDC
jgi:hypothetical protein